MIGFGFGHHFGKAFYCGTTDDDYFCYPSAATKVRTSPNNIQLLLFPRFSALLRPIQRLSITVGLKPEGRLFGYWGNAGGSWEEEKLVHLRWAFSFSIDVAAIIYF